NNTGYLYDWAVDTLTFSFLATQSPDTIINIRVRAMGQPYEYDRLFKVAIEENTAEEGKHYDLLESEYIIKSDSSYGYIPIKIYRQNLLDTIVSMNLYLAPNEYFTQNLAPVIQNNDTIDIMRLTFVFTAEVTQPRYWQPSILGYFSPTKFFLICEMMNMKPEEWFVSSGFSMGIVYGTAVFMTNYLNEKINTEGQAGAIRDPHPGSDRGYMTFPSIQIPAEWPDVRHEFEN
ncbi:MAG: DUF4843 domain-containing protein, partial [Odoribacter sp.]|nr:DUF4843 domain-containing protein [Odoribacter sp.]